MQIQVDSSLPITPEHSSSTHSIHTIHKPSAENTTQFISNDKYKYTRRHSQACTNRSMSPNSLFPPKAINAPPSTAKTVQARHAKDARSSD